MAHLEVDSVSKVYGTCQALSDVSFSLEKDEIACVVGPSGSGKTTLISVLAGITPADSGSVMLGGKDLSRLPMHKRGLALVPQDFKLFPHLTVFENVAFSQRVRRRPTADIKANVERILEQMKVQDLMTRWPSELSGGEAQRIAIARALASEPQALLLDEPLAHVEPGLRRQLEEELIETQELASIPFVMVTHSQEEALAVANVLVVLRKGKVEQTGPARQVYRVPASEFVARFLGGSVAIPVSDSLGNGRFQTPVGVLVSTVPLTASSTRALTFRPSAVRIAHGPPLSLNCLDGVVKRTLFRGLFTEVTVRIAGFHETVIVHVEEAQCPTEGASIRLEIDPAGIVAVPK